MVSFHFCTPETHQSPSPRSRVPLGTVSARGPQGPAHTKVNDGVVNEAKHSP